MTNLKVEYLSSQMRPIKGEKEIYHTINKFRDVIQLIYNQIIPFINQGFTPNEIITNQLI